MFGITHSDLKLVCSGSAMETHFMVVNSLVCHFHSCALLQVFLCELERYREIQREREREREREIAVEGERERVREKGRDKGRDSSKGGERERESSFTTTNQEMKFK